MSKPPDWTCPEINKAQRIMRQLTWRASQGAAEHKSVAWKLLRSGLEVLEQVRAENALMRTAYWEMRKAQEGDEK